MTPSTFLVNNLNDSGPGSLRAAILAANAHPGADMIHFAPAASKGTIPLASGQLNITDNLTIAGPGANQLIVSGSNASRVFHTVGATDVTIRDLTISGGSVTGANGGAILADNPNNSLTLDSVTVIGNSAASDSSSMGGNGGGIYSFGTVALDHSVVGTTAAPNTASQLGGGIWARNGVTLAASTVEGNHAQSGGGIVANVGDVSLTAGSDVGHNSADPNTGMAGGIFAARGNVWVSGSSQVEDNTSWRDGGIVVGKGDVSIGGRSTVTGNVGSDTAFGNGGILDVAGNVSVTGQSSIDHNVSGGMGSGAIVVVFGDIAVSGKSVIQYNTGNGPGGGIAANFFGNVSVTDSQVNHNMGGAIGGGIVNFSGLAGSVTITRSQVNDNTLTDAMTLQQVLENFFGLLPTGSLQNLANAVGGDGGAALSQALQQVPQVAAQVSPQFDQVLQGLPTSDPLAVGGGIGTLLGNPVVVTNSEVSGNQQAFTNNTVGLGGGIFAPRGSVAILHSAINNNVAQNGDGGGIWVKDGPLTIIHSTVNGNSATGDGGGIWNNSVLTILNSQVSGNQAGGDGGGLFNSALGRAVVFNSTIEGNQATGNGGGIANKGTLLIAHSHVEDNQAGEKGGGIANSNTAQYLAIDVIFANNFPDDVSGF